MGAAGGGARWGVLNEKKGQGAGRRNEGYNEGFRCLLTRLLLLNRLMAVPV